MSDYLFRDEAAELLGVTPHRVSRLVKAGQLTDVDAVLVGNVWRPRLLRAEVEALKARRDATPNLKRGGRPRKHPRPEAMLPAERGADGAIREEPSAPDGPAAVADGAADAPEPKGRPPKRIGSLFDR